MKTLKTTLVIALLIFATSCSKNDDPQPQEPIKVTTVYVGGSQKISGLEKATIWKNGVAELLPTNTANASRVASVFVDGNDVYAVGFEVFGNINKATLWKNAAKATLDVNSSEAYCVFAKSNTVYIAGKLYGNATVWSSSTGLFGAFELSNSNASVASGVFVSGTDVYISGNINGESFVWRNNQLPGGFHIINPSKASGVYVNGNDVYVVGSNTDVANSDTPSGTIRKNNIIQNIPITNSHIYSICGDNQNIYAVGGINPFINTARAMIWENNISKQLSQKYSLARSVFSIDGNVYVAGVEYVSSNTPDFCSRVWKNGVVQALSNTPSYAYSVFVTVK